RERQPRCAGKHRGAVRAVRRRHPDDARDAGGHRGDARRHALVDGALQRIAGVLQLQRALGRPGQLLRRRGAVRTAVRDQVDGGSGRDVPGEPRIEADVAETGATEGSDPSVAPARARSRSSYFLIFPVEVFGSGPKRTASGALNPGSDSRAKAISSGSVTSPPSRSVTKAIGRSPHFSLGMAVTAASSTSGWRSSTCSTSIVETFSPPEMMMSLARSRSS